MTHVHATLSDGSHVSAHPEHIGRIISVDRQMESERQAWIADLRAQGVKAAHPDDGWVERETNKVHLCYPDFNDGLEVGDLLALGWSWADTRIVRITDTSTILLAPSINPWYFHFETA